MYEVTTEELIATLEELAAKYGKFVRKLEYRNFKFGPVPDITYFVENAVAFANYESIFWETDLSHMSYVECPIQKLHEVICPPPGLVIGSKFTVHNPETKTYSEYFIRSHG
jgi:hypothetical protein